MFERPKPSADAPSRHRSKHFWLQNGRQTSKFCQKPISVSSLHLRLSNQNCAFYSTVETIYKTNEIINILTSSSSIMITPCYLHVAFRIVFVMKKQHFAKSTPVTLFFDSRGCFLDTCRQILERQQDFYQDLLQNTCFFDDRNCACRSDINKRNVFWNHKIMKKSMCTECSLEAQMHTPQITPNSKVILWWQ